MAAETDRPAGTRATGSGSGAAAGPGRRQPGTPHRTWTDPAADRPSDAPETRCRAVLLRRLVVGFAATAAAFSVAPLLNNALGRLNKDYTLWYRTGRVVLAGGEIYPKDHHLFPFMYPPSCAGMLAAASLGGETAFVVGFLIVQTAAWLAAVLLSVDLVTGKALGQHPRLYVVPTLLVLPFVHDMYLLGQPNLLLLALMLGAFACLKRGRPWCAGGLVALAAGIKAFPVMAVGYFVYRRQWRATAALVVSLAALLLAVPATYRGPARAWDDLATWTRGMVLKYDSGSIAQRPERSFGFKNQSVVALGNRLLRPVLADGEADRRWKVNLLDLDFRRANAVIVAVAAGLGLFFLATMPRASRRTPASDAAEAAALLLLILMFSPLSFNYSYVWLIYPLTVAVQTGLEAPAGSRGRLAALAWVAACGLLLALALPFPKGAQAYGNLFAAALLLLVGLGWRMRQTAAPAG